jgi:hypothetical protein
MTASPDIVGGAATLAHMLLVNIAKPSPTHTMLLLHENTMTGTTTGPAREAREARAEKEKENGRGQETGERNIMVATMLRRL